MVLANENIISKKVTDIEIISNEQIEELIFKTIAGNSELSKNTEKMIKVGRNIMGLLGQNNRLFLEYEIMAGLNDNIKLEAAYRIGFEEGRLYPTKCPTKK